MRTRPGDETGCMACLVLVMACSEGTPAEGRCPTFEAGVQEPVVVESTFERVAGVTDMRHQAVIDESGIYWFDSGGTLYASAHGGDGVPRVLREAPAEAFETYWGMVADETTLVWSEAPARTGPDIEISPPGPPVRLYSMPKTGGEATLLFEAVDDYVTPLAIADGRVIFLWGSEEQSVAILNEDGSWEPLLAVDAAVNIKVIEGQVYWTTGSEDASDPDGYAQYVWRTNLDGSDTQRLARIEGFDVLANGDFVLWLDERQHTDPLVLDQNYVMLDQTTGCIQPLPARGETISSDSMLDDRHVYWFSFNGLAGFSPGDAPGAKPLIRVDLRSGVLERIVTPGYETLLGENVLGQTADTLYVTEGGELVAIRKP